MTWEMWKVFPLPTKWDMDDVGYQQPGAYSMHPYIPRIYINYFPMHNTHTPPHTPPHKHTYE